MSATDELREWAKKFDRAWFNGEGIITFSTFRPTVEDVSIREIVESIADRIDEQHDKDALGEYIRGYYMGFDVASDEVKAADELRERMEREYIKMPVDADGKVIHVEDEVELLDGSKRFKAEWLEWDGEDWVVHETIGYGAYHEPTNLRHIQPDSWERIIEDALSECGWEQPKEYEIDFEDSKETRDRFVAELVERCKRLAGE